MKQWIAGLSVLAVVVVVGCQHQCFLSERDFKNATLPGNLRADLETDPTAMQHALSDPTAAPPDVTQPDRKPRHLTLQEAIAMALENGTTSSRGVPGQGLVDDTPATFPSFSGISIVNQSDSVRVLALAPALNAAFMEQSLARFDPQWVSAMNWSTTDQLQQGLSSFQNGQRAGFFSGLIKPIATGGYLTTFFQADYNLLDNPPQGAFGVLNPSYTTRVIVGFEQPLLQGAGVGINQLLNRLNPFSGATTPAGAAAAFNTRGQVLNQIPSVTAAQTEGILVARLRFNASRAEFERQVNAMVVNVEVAYWNLYQAYGELYTFEEVLRIAHKAWMMGQVQYTAGTLNPANFFPLRGQFEEFRGERLKALGKVLEAERNLRGLMGLPVEDGERLVPITPPTLAEYRPDWQACEQDAVNLRPELIIAREHLRAAQYNLEIQKNFLKPDLRFNAQYAPLGFGTRLDSNGNFVDGAGATRPENALQSLRSNHFDDWSIGLTLSVPLGYRLEHASIRAGRIGLAQSYFALKDQEERIRRNLTQQYQKLSEWYARIEMARSERRAYAESVRVRFAEFAKGVAVGAKGTPVDLLLEAQRRMALAQQKEYQAVGEYNNTLARLEFAKGTLLRFNNIIISEGGLPQCAEVRAVDHERDRAKALVLREKPLPLTHPGRLACDIADLPEVLEMPEGGVAPPADPGFEPMPSGDRTPSAEKIGMPAPLPEKLKAPTPATLERPVEPRKEDDARAPSFFDRSEILGDMPPHEPKFKASDKAKADKAKADKAKGARPPLVLPDPKSSGPDTRLPVIVSPPGESSDRPLIAPAPEKTLPQIEETGRPGAAPTPPSSEKTLVLPPAPPPLTPALPPLPDLKTTPISPPAIHLPLLPEARSLPSLPAVDEPLVVTLPTTPRPAAAPENRLPAPLPLPAPGDAGAPALLPPAPVGVVPIF